MREALVICPQKTNDGRPLGGLKNAAVSRLIEKFGGCTIRQSEGAWVSPMGNVISEPVWELIAATDDTQGARATLRHVARFIGREGQQEAVYLRLPSGTVEIIDTSPQPAAPAIALAA